MKPGPDRFARPDLWKIDGTRTEIKLCAWCPEKEKRVAALLARHPDALLNHGICPACLERELADPDGD